MRRIHPGPKDPESETKPTEAFSSLSVIAVFLEVSPSDEWLTANNTQRFLSGHDVFP